MEIWGKLELAWLLWLDFCWRRERRRSQVRSRRAGEGGEAGERCDVGLGLGVGLGFSVGFFFVFFFFFFSFFLPVPLAGRTLRNRSVHGGETKCPEEAAGRREVLRPCALAGPGQPWGRDGGDGRDCVSFRRRRRLPESFPPSFLPRAREGGLRGRGEPPPPPSPPPGHGAGDAGKENRRRCPEVAPPPCPPPPFPLPVGAAGETPVETEVKASPSKNRHPGGQGRSCPPLRGVGSSHPAKSPGKVLPVQQRLPGAANPRPADGYLGLAVLCLHSSPVYVSKNPIISDRNLDCEIVLRASLRKLTSDLFFFLSLFCSQHEVIATEKHVKLKTSGLRFTQSVL